MKKTLIAKVAVAAVAAAALAQSAQATIVGGAVTGGDAFSNGGTFVKLTPPLSNPFGPANSVGADTFDSYNFYGFDEDQNVDLTADADAEIVAPSGPGTVPNGTRVASHYLFFDPAGTESNSTMVGYMDFDSDILAVFHSQDTMDATDYLANTGVNYLNPGLRGLESGDSVWIDPGNPKRIHFDVAASSPGDYVRVLTKHSPSVPDSGATVGLLGVGAALMAWARRKV